MILDDENPWMVVSTGVLIKTCIRQRHEVVVAVDEVKLARMLKRFGNMKVFGYLRIDGGILFVSLIDHGSKRARVSESPVAKQSYIPAAGGESFCDVARDCLPRPILPGRRSPGNGRKDRNAFSRMLSRGACMAARISASGTVAKLSHDRPVHTGGSAHRRE